MRIIDWSSDVCSSDLDVIVKIDGASTTDFTVEDTAAKLRGPAGSRVRLTIRREGEPAAREVQLTRREKIGRAPRRERVRQYAWISVVGASLQKEPHKRKLTMAAHSAYTKQHTT